MSDFTKEELKELLISLSCRFSRELDLGSKEHLNFTYDLEKKIQSMIDNYCEHQKLSKVYHCDSCNIIEYRCDKCARINYSSYD